MCVYVILLGVYLLMMPTYLSSSSNEGFKEVASSSSSHTHSHSLSLERLLESSPPLPSPPATDKLNPTITLTFPEEERRGGQDPLTSWGVSFNQAEYLFKNSNELVCMGKSSKFTRVSSKWSEVLGWTAEELLNISFFDLIHPDDRVITSETVDKAEKHNVAVFGMENRWRHKDGSYRWLHWITLSPVYGSEDQSILSIARDVTACKDASQRVRDLTSNLHKKSQILGALQQVNSAYLGDGHEEEKEASLDYRFKDLHTLPIILGSFLKISGSIFGSIYEVCYDEQHHPYIKPNSAFTSQEPTLEEFKQDLVDPVLRTVLAHQKPELVEDSPSLGERPISASSQESLAPLQLLGLPLCVHPQSSKPLVGVLILAGARGTYNQNLVEWLEPLTKKASQIINEIKLWRQKKIAEEEKGRKEEEAKVDHEARVKAEAASRSKTAFVAHMSHEMRTPLNAILGFTKLAKTEESPEKRVEYIQNVEEAAESLLTIVNDVLDMSRVEANMLKLETKEFEVRKVAERVINLLRLSASKKDLKLELHVQSHIPTILKGDEGRLQQILFNLVGNAVKFTPDGEVIVTLEGTPLNSSNQSRSFLLAGTIKDTGIGIAPEALTRLFQPFSQADDSLMRQFGGTGLGLYITKELCERMGGRINVFSTPGVGSSFNFSVCMEAGRSPTPLSASSALSVSSTLPSLRILVAEDNLMNQKLTKTMLERMGCNIDIANNGQEAVEAVEKGGYDVVLMDGEMPVMDGLEATRQIRSASKYSNIPIIGLTAHALEGYRNKFIEAGMNAYLSKPIQKKTLVEEILKLCTKNKTSFQDGGSDQKPPKI